MNIWDNEDIERWAFEWSVEPFLPLLHGGATGFCAAGGEWGVEELEQRLAELLCSALGEAELGSEDLLPALPALVNALSTQLDHEDLQFRPWVGDDEIDLFDRVEALQQWLLGYLSGFSCLLERGVAPPPVVMESLRDLTEMAAQLEDVEDVEGGDLELRSEFDLFELLEFAKVTALLARVEMMAQRDAGDVTDAGEPG